MTNNAPVNTKGKNAGFTQAEVKVRNVLEKFNSGLKIENPQTVIDPAFVTKEVEKELIKKFKVKAFITPFSKGICLSEIANFYSDLVASKALASKPVPPKRSNTKVKKMKPETVDVIDFEKKPTKIERKIIKIFNKVHKDIPNSHFKNIPEHRHVVIHENMLTSTFLQAVDKEFGTFLELAEKSTIAVIAEQVKLLRLKNKMIKKVEQERFVFTDIEKRTSIVLSFSTLGINCVSGSQAVDTNYKFWREFDKWYKKNGKKLRAKPKFKSDALKSIHGIATDLHSVGAISDLDKAKFDKNAVKQ